MWLQLSYWRDEREKYVKHRRKAEKFPSRYLSLIIDGMDQEKTNIPHIISNPKPLAGNYTLETHVTGVRVHGRCSIMFIDCCQFKHDSNLTITMMLRVFLRMKVFMHAYIYSESMIFMKTARLSSFSANRILFHLYSMCKWITHAGTIKINTH